MWGGRSRILDAEGAGGGVRDSQGDGGFGRGSEPIFVGGWGLDGEPILGRG